MPGVLKVLVGGVWTDIAIGVPANVAYNNVDNNFTKGQHIAASGVGSDYSQLVLTDLSRAVDAKKFRFVNTAGILYIQALNDAESAAPGVVTIDRLGNLYISGGQVKFPITQLPSSDPNTLDDYEEGVWTPVLTFGGAASPGIVYGTREGVYTKIGRLVNLYGRISVTNKGTGVGIAIVTGIPFTVIGESHGIMDTPAGFSALPSQPFALGTGASIYLCYTTVNGRGILGESHFTNTSDFRFSFTYQAN
jgi:hypothetical protein